MPINIIFLVFLFTLIFGLSILAMETSSKERCNAWLLTSLILLMTTGVLATWITIYSKFNPNTYTVVKEYDVVKHGIDLYILDGDFVKCVNGIVGNDWQKVQYCRYNNFVGLNRPKALQHFWQPKPQKEHLLGLPDYDPPIPFRIPRSNDNKNTNFGFDGVDNG